jgi:hypothetical protein
METEYIKMILEGLDIYSNYQEIAEVINDANAITNMIINYPTNYNKNLVSYIITKYKNEIENLRRIEIKFKHINGNTSKITEKQELLNLRYCLVRIGVLRIAEIQNENILEQDIIGDDEKVLELLLKLIKKTIDKNKKNI